MYRGFNFLFTIKRRVQSLSTGPATGAALIRAYRLLSLYLLANPKAEGGLGPQTPTAFTPNRLVKVGQRWENGSAAVIVPS